MGKIVFIALLIFLTSKKTVYGRERKYIQLPSPFLQPPPVSRSIKVIPLLNKHPPIIKPQYAEAENQYSMNSVIPRIANWFWPTAKASDKVLQTSLSKPVWETSQNFSIDDRKCNPCNSVPWIPIVGVGRSIPRPETNTPFSHFPVPSPTPGLPSETYYSSLNQIHTNLIHHPMFFNPPMVYNPPPHHLLDPPVSQNVHEFEHNLNLPATVPEVHQDLSVPQVHEDVYQTDWNNSPNCPNGICFSSSGADSIQEPSIQNPRNIGFESNDLSNNTGPSAPVWVQEPKKMPLSHYLLSVDYPLQIFQTPLLDVPYQLPDLHSSSVDLPQHVQKQVYSSTVAPQFSSSAEAAPVYKDIHNLEDNRYSPSESQFSSLSADTNHINESFTEIPTSTMLDYLTPPTVSSNDEWTISENNEDSPPKKKKQIQIVIPYTVNKSSTKNSTEKAARFRDISDTRSTTPLPIVSFLRGSNNSVKYAVPGKRQEYSDLIRLQKAIDTWTVQGYSNHKQKPNEYFFQKIVTSTLPPSKEIPKNYLNNGPINYIQDIRMQPVMEEKMHRTNEDKKNKTAKPWEKLPVAVSPVTNEKVYIVTPLPLTSFNFSADGAIQNWP